MPPVAHVSFLIAPDRLRIPGPSMWQRESMNIWSAGSHLVQAESQSLGLVLSEPCGVVALNQLFLKGVNYIDPGVGRVCLELLLDGVLCRTGEYDQVTEHVSVIVIQSIQVFLDFRLLQSTDSSMYV